MSDVEILARQIERFASDADKRERAAAERHATLVKAITAGFAGVAKEIRDGFTLIQHTIIDEFRQH